MPGDFDKLSLHFETLCAELKQAKGPNDRRAVLQKMAATVGAMEALVKKLGEAKAGIPG